MYKLIFDVGHSFGILDPYGPAPWAGCRAVLFHVKHHVHNSARWVYG